MAQSLSSTENCGKTQANKTLNGSWDGYIYPEFTSESPFYTPASYTHADCASAYVLDAYVFDPFGDTSGNWAQHNGTPTTAIIQYGDSTVPTSKSACERRRLMVYVWSVDFFSPFTATYLGLSNRWGTWTNNHCNLPVYATGAESQFAGYNFHGTNTVRFAVSARYYSSPKDATSSYVTKPILFNYMINSQLVELGWPAGPQ